MSVTRRHYPGMFLPRMLTPLLSVKAERDRLYQQWLERFEALSSLDANNKNVLRPTLEGWARAFAPLQAQWTYVALFFAFIALCSFALLGLVQFISLIPLSAEYHMLILDLTRTSFPVLFIGYGLMWFVTHLRDVKTSGHIPAAAVGLYLLTALYFLEVRQGQVLDAESKRLVARFIESAAVVLERHMARFMADGDILLRAEARERFRSMAAGLRDLKPEVIFWGERGLNAHNQLADILKAWALGNWADLPSTTPRRVSLADRYPTLHRLWIGGCAAGLVIGMLSAFKSQPFPPQTLLVLPFLITSLFDQRTGEALKSLLDVLERIRGPKP